MTLIFIWSFRWQAFRFRCSRNIHILFSGWYIRQWRLVKIITCLGVNLSSSSISSIVNRLINRTWITFKLGIWSTVLQEGPCSPARTSQIKFGPIRDEKYFSHERFIFSIVSSSCESKGTNSRGLLVNIFGPSHWLQPITFGLLTHCLAAFSDACLVRSSYSFVFLSFFL